MFYIRTMRMVNQHSCWKEYRNEDYPFTEKDENYTKKLNELLTDENIHSIIIHDEVTNECQTLKDLLHIIHW